MGIKVLTPDVNRSAATSRPVPPRRRAPRGRPCRREPGAIPFGLSAVRNVGEGLVELLLAEREANGPFADFYDFCERVDPRCSTSARSSR
jgi:DNA polymerase III subunit alpha